MDDVTLQTRLKNVADSLVSALITITPETMREIQFEIVATDDGGADFGLLDSHPDTRRVALSDRIYQLTSQYLPLVKQMIPHWKRSLIVLRQGENDHWNVSMDFERS